MNPWRRPWVLLALIAIAVPCGAGDRSVGAISAERPPAEAKGDLARHATVLGVGESELRELQLACREAGFTAEEFSRLMTLVTRAKLAGLPHRQLLNKLEEGLAKRAMPERVLGALEERARRLSEAKEIVDRLIVQGCLAPDYTLAVAMVADALGAGASPAELVRAVRYGERGRQVVPDVRTAFLEPAPPGK